VGFLETDPQTGPRRCSFQKRRVSAITPYRIPNFQFGDDSSRARRPLPTRKTWDRRVELRSTKTAAIVGSFSEFGTAFAFARVQDEARSYSSPKS
jgi:hypothetical protein